MNDHAERTILVRGYGKKPSRLQMLGLMQFIATKKQNQHTHIVVYGTKRDLAIGWPIYDAFNFDADLFDSLIQAHESENDLELRRLWGTAIPLSPLPTNVVP